MMSVGCTIKSLPPRLHELASDLAIRIHPGNAEPLRIGLMTTKYWGPAPRVLSVGFLEPPAPQLAARILSHMNAWGCCVTFAMTMVDPVIRVSLRGAGYWSYLGTDCLHVPPDLPTMCLEGFSMETEDSEFYRVVRHETGHSLGFQHEHMRMDLVARIDPLKAVAYFGITQGWGPQEVRDQVLTPLDEADIFGTPADETSIMCYQLPGSITTDGRPIVGGLDLNANDRALAALVYPMPGLAAGDPVPHDDQHWPEEEDVAVELLA